MAQITYANKVALNENPEIAAINKVSDDDMNEIKQVVNDNYNNTIQITDTEPTDSDNKLWIDTGEIGSAVSEITNEYSTSIGLGYSANYINNMNTYSTTDEVRIGIWIDGKPIYRKTFIYENLSQISSGSYGNIGTLLSNVNVINIKAININTSLNISRLVPYNDGTNRINIITTDSGHNIRIYVNGGSMFTQNDNAIITLEYTKTTD